jgi:hypothetical protein
MSQENIAELLEQLKEKKPKVYEAILNLIIENLSEEIKCEDEPTDTAKNGI